MKKLEKIEELAQGISVVKFFADWCGPCRVYTPIMENVSKNIDSVSFYSVNTDERPDLAAKFNVNGIPATFIMKDGKIVENFTGIRNAKDITTLINRYKN
jgi:thioredoxin 1